jgi:outer membrane protein assembly factor BamB
MPNPGRRRWLRRGLIAVGCLVVLVGIAVAVLLLHKPGNVSNLRAPITITTQPKPLPPRSTVQWLRYGYDAARSRYFPGGRGLKPPFHVNWKFQDYAELEFPPAMNGNYLYMMDDDGSVKELDKLTGKKLWETKVGTLAAATPALAVAQGLLFVPVLSDHGSKPGTGSFVALSIKTGKVVWRHPLPAGSESSPVALGDSVYFGDQAGRVYDLGVRDGHVVWTYKATAAVKGGPALAHGHVFFGDYAGRAYALNATNGHQIWAVNTNGANFGFGSGNFYVTPSLAFGRVYMGNTDGRVYSFVQRNGELAWATSTGAYVYSSAAVANVPNLGPTVYLGSYDGNFYAFNARTGAIRWTHHAGGRISGSAMLVNGIVYYQDLGSRTTAGLWARNGKQVFSFPDGQFNGVVVDNGALYLSGRSMLYRLLPDHSSSGTGGTTTKVNPPKSSGAPRRGKKR